MGFLLRLAALPVLAYLLGACAAIDSHGVLWREPRTAHPVQAMDRETREAAHALVRDIINARYYDSTFNGVDWLARSADYRDRVLEAASDAEAWQALDHMAGLLRDAHTRVESPEEARRRDNQEELGFGFSVRMMAGRLTVERVLAHSEAWRNGVRPGMGLIRINGMDARAAYERLLQAGRGNSTPQARELIASRRVVEGPRGERVALEFATADDKPLSIALDREHFAAVRRVEARTLPSGIGYVGIADFHDDQEAAIVAAVREMRATPALVLDLRANRGGAMRVVRALAGELFSAPQLLSSNRTRNGGPVSLFFGAFTVVPTETRSEGRGPDAYAGKLVVLIDRASASAAELAAGALQATGRAQIVGETSCGCVVGFLGYVGVPGGGRLAYSEVGLMLPNNRRIEGSGVVPDRAVTLQASDLADGKDRALEVAEQMLLAPAPDNAAAAPSPGMFAAPPTGSPPLPGYHCHWLPRGQRYCHGGLD